MKKTSWHHLNFYISIIILLSLSHACSGTPSSPSTQVPLSTATDFPKLPTITPEPSPTVDAVATIMAYSTEVTSAKKMEVEEILAGYEIDLPEGELSWEEKDEISVSQTNYRRISWQSIANQVDYKNYILYTRSTWTSTSGIAGCGIIVRLESDIIDGEYYLFNTTRLSGAASWKVEYWDEGKRVNYPSGGSINTDYINIEQGSTNEYVLVMLDNELNIYANGYHLGHVLVSSLDEGMLGVVVWQESGETECAFNDSWLWRINE